MRASRPRSRAAAAVTAVACGLLVAAAPADAATEPMPVSDLDFRGEATLPAQLSFEGTEVGGLSSITFDGERNVYYAISDARPEVGQGPFRLYTLRITAGDGTLSPGDVTVLGVTQLTDAAGEPFAPGSLDPEGLALTDHDTLVLTSEGLAAAVPPVAPRVLELDLSGRQVRELDVPSYADPVLDVSGVRNNLGLESAGFTPNHRFLFTGFENALVQDGPAATLESGSPVRLLRYGTRSGRLREFVYETDPVAVQPDPVGGFTVSGLVEVLPLTGRSVVTMERSFSLPASNTIRLYHASLAGATDVAGVADLDDVSDLQTADKHLLLDLDELGLTLDNIEGMTLGQRLPDGRRALVLVSDNNFTVGQPSQFLMFAVPGFEQR